MNEKITAQLLLPLLKKLPTGFPTERKTKQNQKNIFKLTDVHSIFHIQRNENKIGWPFGTMQAACKGQLKVI